MARPRTPPVPPPLKPLEVAVWLRHNPDFLSAHPEILSALLPPAATHDGPTVKDLQSYLVQRLQNGIQESQAREQQVLNAARRQAQALARVHDVVLRLLEAQGAEDFFQRIASDIPSALHCDVARLVIERGNPLPRHLAPYLRALPLGSIHGLFGARDTLVASGGADETLFAEEAPMLRSTCLLRLHPPQDGVAGLLALGSRDAARFELTESSEALLFLAQFLSRLMPMKILANA